MSSVSVRPIDRPVRHKIYVNRYEDNSDVVKGVDGGSGASVTDAAVALSQLPVLGRFREGLGLVFAISTIIANFAALVYLVYHFGTSCAKEYGVLPNESGDLVPPALAELENQAGVTMISRSLVYFQANDTYMQGNLTFWTPFQPTCGCAECNLASCAATIPIVVEYERCNPWAEVFALAAGFIVYVNVAFAAFFALVLGVIPCAKKPGATGSTFWDFVVAVSEYG